MQDLCSTVQIQPTKHVLDRADCIYIRLPPGNKSYIIQIVQIVQIIQIRNLSALPGTSRSMNCSGNRIIRPRCGRRLWRGTCSLFRDTIIPFITFALLFSLSLQVVTQIRRVTQQALLPPYPLRSVPCIFIAKRCQLFFFPRRLASNFAYLLRQALLATVDPSFFFANK